MLHPLTHGDGVERHWVGSGILSSLKYFYIYHNKILIIQNKRSKKSLHKPEPV